MIGIYYFKNKINNKMYIGQSIDIINRYNSHKNTYLNKNSKDYNKFLYQAFRKYGFDNFEFKILEEVDKEFLNEREIYWIEIYNTFIDGYNLTIGGNNAPILLGEENGNSKLTEEQVYYIREQFVKGKNKLEIYKEFSFLNREYFSYLWQGRFWTHVHMDVYEKRSKLNLGGSKLDPNEILNLRTLYMNGMSIEELNKLYSQVSTNTIKRIINLRCLNFDELVPEDYSRMLKKKIQDLSTIGKPKLSNEQVLDIRIRFNNGDDIKNIIHDYSDIINRKSILNIIQLKTWNKPQYIPLNYIK